MREHRLAPLLDAMVRHGLAKPASDAAGESIIDAGGLDWYVDLRRWGSSPHGGFGLGFDRLLCYLSGIQTIRDIVAFPRYVGRCDC
jgi:asparaginyl-tRNA synthetase